MYSIYLLFISKIEISRRFVFVCSDVYRKTFDLTFLFFSSPGRRERKFHIFFTRNQLLKTFLVLFNERVCSETV